MSPQAAEPTRREATQIDEQRILKLEAICFVEQDAPSSSLHGGQRSLTSPIQEQLTTATSDSPSSASNFSALPESAEYVDGVLGGHAMTLFNGRLHPQ